MDGMDVAAKKLRFWNKVASIDADNRLIWSMAMNLSVKNKIILIII
jgi:hypothetical protein